MHDRTATTVLTALSGLLGHYGGDFLAQDDCMAARKQQRTVQGRRELTAHATVYAAVQAVTKAVLYRTAGVHVPVLAQLAGALTEGCCTRSSTTAGCCAGSPASGGAASGSPTRAVSVVGIWSVSTTLLTVVRRAHVRVIPGGHVGV